MPAGQAPRRGSRGARRRSIGSSTRASGDQGIVGASFVLLSDHQTAHARTVGFADLASKRPVDADTIFHWASITKTFTAIAIMQLRDRGLLSLDDPIVKYMPELRQVHNPFGPMEAITLRMLMSHSAGFRNPTWPWGGDQDVAPVRAAGWSQVVGDAALHEDGVPAGLEVLRTRTPASSSSAASSNC